VHKAVELDEAKRAEGSDLDEFQAHRFLEHFKETLTVQVTSPLPTPLASSFFPRVRHSAFSGVDQINWL
jgi:hypothetical protein